MSDKNQKEFLPPLSAAFTYKNALDMAEKLVKTYISLKYISSDSLHVRPRLILVMAFYILKGYSEETKELIVDSLETTKQNLNTINLELTKLGLLQKDPMNHRNKKISPEIMGFCKSIATHPQKTLTISFKHA